MRRRWGRRFRRGLAFTVALALLASVTARTALTVVVVTLLLTAAAVAGFRHAQSYPSHPLEQPEDEEQP